MKRLKFSAAGPDWLSAVTSQLKQNMAGGKPPLTATPLDAEIYRAAVTALFDPRVLGIDHAKLNQSAQSVSLQGTATLFGQPVIPVTLGYAGVDGSCFFELEASPSSWKPLAALTTLGLPIGDLCVRWSYGPLSAGTATNPVPPSSHVSFGASVTLADMPLPVSIEPPQKPDVSGLWRLFGNFDAQPLAAGLKPIVQWIQKAAGLPELPALGKLTGLVLSGIDFAFDPTAPRLMGGMIAVKSTASWPLVGKQVVLDHVLVSLGFSANQTGYDLHGEIAATMGLGSETVQVVVSQDTASDLTALSLRSADAALPNIAALADLAGVPKLASAIPAPLRELSGLRIEEFRTEINSKAGKLSLVHIALACPKDVLIAPKTNLENLRMSLDLTPQAATKVSGSVTGLLDVAGSYVGFQGELGDSLALCGTVDNLPLSALAGRLTGGLPKALPEIDLQNVSIQLDSQGEFHFDASVKADFSVLAKALKVPIPDGMAKLQLSSLSLDLHADGTWNVALTTDQPFKFPVPATKGAQQLDLHDIHLSFGVGASKKFAVAGSFVLSGGLSIGSDLSVELVGNGLIAKFGGADWTVGGTANITAFGTTFKGWSARIDQNVFCISHDKPISVFTESFASATIDSFTIAVLKQQSAQGDTKWGFEVEGKGTMQIAGVTKTTGNLTIDTTTKRLVLSVQNPPVPKIRLAPPVSLDIGLKDLKLSRDANTWSFGSEATLTLNDVPGPLKKYLPSRAEGELKITDKGVDLVCKLDEKIDFGPLAIKIADKEIPLGNPQITLQQLEMDFGKNFAVAAQMQVAIPNDLNRLLGWDKKFQPTTIFLNPSMDLRLTLGKKNIGLVLVNDTSPFKALKIIKGKCKWVLSEVGTFDFDVPALSFKGSSWTGSFGMSHGPLSIPLRPVKFLMNQLGIPGSKLVPDSLPIPDNINLTQLGSVLPKLLGKDIWKALPKDVAAFIKKMIDAIGTVSGDVAKKYPVDFVDYLTLHIPNTIHMDIDTGGPALALWTDDKEPLKFLLPWLAAMPPGLAGFTLKKIQFGQVAGTLGLLTVDGHADYFDVVTLAVSALPGVNARGFRNRLTASNTVAVIPSAFPFPIPLFYDDLSWELKSWPGLGVTTDWKMPAKWDMFETGSALFKFFSDKKYLLSKDAKEAFDIQFQIGSNYIAFPDYLGGGQVGLPRGVKPALPLGDSLKRLLDTLKTGNLTYLITAIPLHDKDQKTWYRLGMQKASVSFGPLTFSAGIGWCAVTQEELNKDVLPNPKAKAILGEINNENVLQSLPTKASEPSYQEGFVVMLMGEAGVQPIISAKAYFGMALTAAGKYDDANEGGFECGFLLQGTMVEFMSLMIRGDIHVDRQEVTRVRGDCSLKIADFELIGGGTTVTVGKDMFDMEVTLRLAGDACRIVGRFHIDPKRVFISGGFVWTYGSGAGQTISEANVTAIFTQHGIAIEITGADFFGITASITLFADARVKGYIGARADIDISAVSKYVMGQFQAVADDVGKTAHQLQDKYKKLLADYQGNMSTAQLLARFLKGLKKDLPGMVKKEVYKRAPYPFKGKAWGIAQGQLKPILKDMGNLANDLQTADAKRAKGLIIGLINAVLKARVKFRVAGISIINKSIWQYADSKYKKQLQGARAFVEKIPAQKLVAQNAKGEWKKYLGQHDIAEEIAKAVKSSSGSIPQITQIQWETTQLVKLSAVSTVKILCKYKNKPFTIQAPLDLAHPAKSGVGIAKAVVKAIAN